MAPNSSRRARRAVTLRNTFRPGELEWAVELPLDPRPIRGRVSLTMTADLERGLAHFVAHGVLTEVSA